MTIKEITAQLNKNRSRLLQYAESLSEPQLHHKSGESHWSAAEMLHHLYLAEKSISELLDRLVERARRRGQLTGSGPGDIEIMEKLVHLSPEDYAGIPPFPGTEPRTGLSREELIGLLRESRPKIEAHVSLSSERDLAHILFPHPLYGRLSFYEWLLYIAKHEGSHIQAHLSLRNGEG